MAEKLSRANLTISKQSEYLMQLVNCNAYMVCSQHKKTQSNMHVGITVNTFVAKYSLCFSDSLTSVTQIISCSIRSTSGMFFVLLVSMHLKKVCIS